MNSLLELLLSLFGKGSSAPAEVPLKQSFKEPLLKPIDKKLDILTYEKEIQDNLHKESEIEPIQFKGFGTKLSEDFKDLTKKNLPLKVLLEDLNIYVNQEFKKTLTITMISRTDAEQDYLYRNDERYQKKKFKSPHQFLHAADVRSRDFTAKEIKQIEDYLNKKWNKSNYYKWTAKCHTIGAGIHFHLQYLKP